MSELINQNVFDSSKKFVDFEGLDYFWEKAKAYVDGADSGLSSRIDANAEDISSIQDELNSLSGGAGSIATQIENAIAKLDKDDEAVSGQYVSAVSEADGVITVTRADLPVYEAVGSAKAVQDLLDAHEADAVAHITADERSAWNSAKSSIDTFLKDADMTESAVDTLKELQTYMTSDGAAAAELVNRVAALEAIDHDAYKAADETNLASAKAYADEKDSAMDTRVKVLEAIDHDAYKAADETNLASAKSYTDEKDSAMDTRVKVLEAIDHSVYAIASDVETAIANAKAAAIADADAKLATNSAADQAYAKAYTDELFNSIQFASTGDIDGLFSGE